MRIALLVFALSGCTLVGGTLGGISGRSANAEHRAKREPEEASVGGRVLVGALVGLVIDALIINRSLEESLGDCCR
jgi:hypothetical protein